MHGLRLSPATVAVSAGRTDRRPGAPLNPPISPASAFVPGGDSEYARAGNPAWEPFETVLGELEGGHALAYSSGLAAAAAVFDLVPVGGVVVAPRDAYYGTVTALQERARRRMLELRLVDVTDTEEVVAAAADAALLWVETPTNPGLQVADLAAIVDATRPTGTAIAVDNTFATPLRQRPLEVGADFSVHSASKLLSGHSDVLLGAVVTGSDRAYAALEARRTRNGAVPGALEVWLATRGMRTLHVRLERAEANARVLFERLASSPHVEDARYPGFGTIVSFEPVGTVEDARTITENSVLVAHATSLGGVESTWERRRRHAGEPDSVPDRLIRLSVGIEDAEDLWEDVRGALESVSAPSGSRASLRGTRVP